MIGLGLVDLEKTPYRAERNRTIIILSLEREHLRLMKINIFHNRIVNVFKEL